MKLIIDIPEREYMEIKRYYDSLPEYSTVEAETYYIAHGTPLDDVTEAISEKYANTHYMYPEYASGLSYAYGIIDKCVRKAESETN